MSTSGGSGIRKTVAFGVALAMGALLVLISTGPAVAGQGGLRVTVNPKSVVVGKKTCFRFRVEKGGQSLSHETILFNGKTFRTSKNGRAGLCTKLRTPGRHPASVSDGKHLKSAFVKARKGPAGHGHQAAWRPFRTVITMGRSEYNRCEKPVEDWWTHDNSCDGQITAGTYPFQSDRNAAFAWLNTDAGSRGPRTTWTIKTAFGGKGETLYNELHGLTFHDQNDRALQITSGVFRQGSITRVVGGDDPAEVGNPKGPLRLTIVTRVRPGTGVRYFELSAEGYLWY